MKNKNSDLFLMLAITFVVCLLLSNILAAKLLKIGDYSITAGILVFPISYIINDIFSEVYGYERTKKVVLFGFLMTAFMVFVFEVAIFLPAPIWYEKTEAFETILGTTPRTCFAGLLAYLLGSLVNAKVLVKMKEKKNNPFGVRAIVSTIFGEATDSLIFVTIAFIGSLPVKELITMIILQVILKTAYETIFLPITMFFVRKAKKLENMEG